MTVAPKTFSGKRLRLMRERAKMTQIDLAEESKSTQAQISAWERGRVVPNRASIDAMCKALKCGTEDLCE